MRILLEKKTADLAKQLQYDLQMPALGDISGFHFESENEIEEYCTKLSIMQNRFDEFSKQLYQELLTKFQKNS